MTTTGSLLFFARAARGGARGAAVIACAAMLGALSPTPASAQTSVSPDGREIIVGDLPGAGFALRFACEGAAKTIELLSNRDLQNAYGRALGGGGKVRRVVFSTEDERAIVDLEALEGRAAPGGAPVFIYRIELGVEGAPTPRAFADTLISGRRLSVDRFDRPILTDGLGLSLLEQDALCPL